MLRFPQMRSMRIAIIKSMIAPYTVPVLERVAEGRVSTCLSSMRPQWEAKQVRRHQPWRLITT